MTENIYVRLCGIEPDLSTETEIGKLRSDHIRQSGHKHVKIIIPGWDSRPQYPEADALQPAQPNIYHIQPTAPTFG